MIRYLYVGADLLYNEGVFLWYAATYFHCSARNGYY